MLSLQELSDRAEIQDLIVRYAHAIDDQNWDALDAVFTPDAIIDYTEVGGPRGPYPEIKQYLAETLPRFSPYQHLSTTTRLEIDGDKARARTILFNPMTIEHEGQRQMFFVGLWYNDELVRTGEGWRIAHRREEKSWNFNAPSGLMP
ncbi:MAG TPA: nuclear transport factor 2 family protein [Pedomonas sp.]|nr:nuclear transport factor 2 family protein [Pedomonas sp.]